MSAPGARSVVVGVLVGGIRVLLRRIEAVSTKDAGVQKVISGVPSGEGLVPTLLNSAFPTDFRLRDPRLDASPTSIGQRNDRRLLKATHSKIIMLHGLRCIKEMRCR